MSIRCRSLLVLPLLLSATPRLSAEWPAPAEVRLVGNGLPCLAVVTSATANAATALAARDLATVLSAMCGTNVSLACGDGLTVTGRND